jgi:hypothetical protein
VSFLCSLSTYIVEMVSISAEIVHVRIVHWKFLQQVERMIHSLYPAGFVLDF